MLGWRLVRGPRFTTEKQGAGRRVKYLPVGTVVVGGFVAPVVQRFVLTVTPASTASLLLNFEIVATVLLAFFCLS